MDFETVGEYFLAFFFILALAFVVMALGSLSIYLFGFYAPLVIALLGVATYFMKKWMFD